MLELKQITNKKIWEDFLIAYQGNYPFFQSWNWGEIQSALGHTIWRIGLFDSKKLLGVCLIVEVKAKRGQYLYLRHGPVLQVFSETSLDAFLSFTRDLAKKVGASFIRVSRFPKTESSQKFFTSHHFIQSALQITDAEYCWVLNITSSEEELLKNMRKSHRYLIKKSQASGITIIKTKNIDDIHKFLPLYKELSQRKHFVAHKGVTEEFETFAKDNEEVLFLAEYEKKIIAGALIAFVGNSAIYRHSASDDQYKHLPASYLIQWEAIKEAKKRGKSIYNFWGIAPPNSKNHPWQGLTSFKVGFYGEYEYFLPVLDLPLTIQYWKSYIIDWISAKKKK